MLLDQRRRTGLRLHTTIVSLKGALPAAIAIAAYQAPVWAGTYTTLGYFVAIIATLSMAMQPRAKFFQSIFTNIIFVMLAVATNLLMMFCAVKARNPDNSQHLRPRSSSMTQAPYDSSANAVAAVWLFMNVFLSNYLKSKRPQCATPAIQFNIYSITAAVYAPSFGTMAAAVGYTRRLMITFLTGYAIAAGVNILVWPTTSRDEVKRQLGDLLESLQDCIRKYQAYVDTFDDDQKSKESGQSRAEVVEKLRDQTREASDMFGAIKMDLDFARKEVAFGKLRPDDLHEIYVGLREVLQPMMGLTALLRIVSDKLDHNTTSESSDSSDEQDTIQDLSADDWKEIVLTSGKPHTQLQDAMIQALDHIGIQLQLLPRAREQQNDAEQNDGPRPGHTNFADHFEEQLQTYQKRGEEFNQDWQGSDTNRPQDKAGFSRQQSDESGISSTPTNVDSSQTQSQSQLTLYLTCLWQHAGQAILRQARLADDLITDGTMAHSRFIFPGIGPICKLIMGGFMDPNQDDAMGMHANNGSNIWIGDVLNEKKDPEHLAPANLYEKTTHYLRSIPQALSSEHASFGLRCAVATLSIALLGFFARTRPFFLDQRGIWAASTTAIAMKPQFGSSISAFCMRVLGTAAAAGLSIATTYIADHNLPAIIVLLFLQIAFWLYLSTKKPSFELAAVIGSVTVIVIIGYQLQVDVIGRQLATKSGQAYYPVYLLAPYRLVAILAGLFVALFWSIFPFPLTARSSLRCDTADTILLLAHYHSCVLASQKIYAQLGTKTDKISDSHPVKRLEETRQEIFGKAILMLGQLRDHLESSRYEPRIGGKFPHDQYEEMIECLSRVFTYLTLITYSSKAFLRGDMENSSKSTTVIMDEKSDPGATRSPANSHTSGGSDQMNKMLETTSHELTSVLCLLSASMHNGQPLPPYVWLSPSRSHHHRKHKTTAARGVAETDENDSKNLLRHTTSHTNAAHAVNQITGSLLNREVMSLTNLIKELVGELDFTYRMMSRMDLDGEDGDTDGTRVDGSRSRFVSRGDQPRAAQSTKKVKGS